MIALAAVLGLAAGLVALALIGGAKRQRQADTIADLKAAEQIHHDAATSRGPIADPDTVLRNANRLRD